MNRKLPIKPTVKAPTPEVKAPERSDGFTKVMAKINSDYGEISHTANKLPNFGRISTGVLVLDIALGGGWKRSSCGLLWGERSAGKTTLAILSVANALKQFPDKIAVWVDAERSFDKFWAVQLGVDLSRLHVVEPPYGEAAVDIIDAFLRTTDVCMVVLDSVASLLSNKEIEESAEANFMGVRARLFSMLGGKVNHAFGVMRKEKHYPALLLLNQMRLKIGVMFGDPRTMPGGKAVEHLMSQCVLMKNKEHKLDKGDNAGLVVFNEHTFEIVKDKTGGRIKEGKFKLIRDELEGYPAGYVEQAKTIMTFAANVGLYKGAGANHTFEGYPTIKGTHADVSKFFLENKQMVDDLCSKIVKAYAVKWKLV